MSPNEATTTPQPGQAGKPVGEQWTDGPGSTLIVSERPVDPVDPPPARRGGRKPGSTTATFANLKALTLQDFAFVRGIVSGMKPADAFRQFYANRYFDANGDVAVHGHTVTARAEQLMQQIANAAQLVQDEQIRAAGRRFAATQAPVQVSEAVREQAHLAFEDWTATLPDGMFGENEMAERYQDYLAQQDTPEASRDRAVMDEAASITSRVAALNHLQTVLAVPPRPDQPVGMWFAPSLAARLAGLKLSALGELVRWIAWRGPRWHSDVKGLGPKRAARVLGWLREAEGSLGRIDGPAWDHVGTTLLPATTSGSLALPSPTGQSISNALVPLTLLQVPDRLSGVNGEFRNPKGNAWNAWCDLEAIRHWLHLYEAAGRVRTLEAYQRELERFYLWCIVKRAKALSSINSQDALAYQEFLGAVPPEWITWRRVARTHRLWRPFRGQLDFVSQHYAIAVVREFYDACLHSGYLTINPFADVKAHAKARRKKRLDATRSLSDEDLQLVGAQLAALPGLKSKDPLRRALALRTQLIVHLALTTGLRLAEIVSASTVDLRRQMVDGELAWVLSVEGKGSKLREATLHDHVHALVAQHHRDWRSLVGSSNPDRTAAFERRPPLVAALHARAGDGIGSNIISDQTELAHDNGALSRVGLYRTLKTFFKLVGCMSGADATRFGKVSTHWLRHTFAHHVLRTSPGDQGLKLAQQLLGHDDISTTAEYLKQANTDLIRASRRVQPLGNQNPS